MLGTRVNRHTLLKTNDVFPKKWMVGVNDSNSCYYKMVLFQGTFVHFRGVCVDFCSQNTWILVSFLIRI